jgi:hypothetical protein
MAKKMKNFALWFLLIYSILFVAWGIWDNNFKNTTRSEISTIKSNVSVISKLTKYNSEMILGHDTIFKQILLGMGHLNNEFDTIKITLKKVH